MNCKRLTRLGALACAALLAACGVSDYQPEIEHLEGCSHGNVLPELKLTAEHEALLAKQSDSPRTALDFYLDLPASFFGNVEDTTPERRVSFIEMESLTDRWLRAGHFFECDGGGFEVVMRVFETKEGALIAIDEWKNRWCSIHKEEHSPRDKINSITVGVPKFWRLVDGKWIEAKGVVLPAIDKDWVMDRYRSDFEKQYATPYPNTYIWLNYELPQIGDEIRLTGRANYMDPDGDYLWQVLKFDGRHFVEVPLPQ